MVSISDLLCTSCVIFDVICCIYLMLYAEPGNPSYRTLKKKNLNLLKASSFALGMYYLFFCGSIYLFVLVSVLLQYPHLNTDLQSPK